MLQISIRFSNFILIEINIISFDYPGYGLNTKSPN